MSAPVRIQLRRTKGWRMPPGAVKVDRSTRWGNPWRVRAPAVLSGRWRVEGPGLGAHPASGLCGNQEGAALLAVRLFRGHVESGALLIGELRGRDLACWCKPGAPCHADVLLELANAGGDGSR